MKTISGKELFQYWDKIRNKLIAPPISEFNPAHIVHLIPDLFLLDATFSANFNFNMFSDSGRKLFGRELKGASILQIFEQHNKDEVYDVLQQSREFGLPVSILANGAKPKEMVDFQVEIALFPLCNEASEIHRLLGIFSNLEPFDSMHCRPIDHLEVSDICLLLQAEELGAVSLRNEPTRESHHKLRSISKAPLLQPSSSHWFPERNLLISQLDKQSLHLDLKNSYKFR